MPVCEWLALWKDHSIAAVSTACKSVLLLTIWANYCLITCRTETADKCSERELIFAKHDLLIANQRPFFVGIPAIKLLSFDEERFSFFACTPLSVECCRHSVESAWRLLFGLIVINQLIMIILFCFDLCVPYCCAIFHLALPNGKLIVTSVVLLFIYRLELIYSAVVLLKLVSWVK